MYQRLPMWVGFAILLIAGTGLAEDSPEPGHSAHGGAFNDGPRQAAYLMDGLATVHFPITGASSRGQAFFDQGLAQLHGFWFLEAERSFRQAYAIDQTPMALWGMATANMTRWRNRAKDFGEKLAEIDTAELTEVERHLIAATCRYLEEDSVPSTLPDQVDKTEPECEDGDLPEKPDTDTDENKADGDTAENDKKEPEKKRSSDEARLDFVKHVWAAVEAAPDSTEPRAVLASFLCYHWHEYLEKLGETAESADDLLDEILTRNPDHPAYHFRIHLWDESDDEKRAIAAAARCGSTSPGIAHMWHMSGHTYVPLNRFGDAAWHQEASSRVDHAQMRRDQLFPDQVFNYAHNQEWLARNLSYVGRVSDALEVAQDLIENPRHPRFNNANGDYGSAPYGRNSLLRVLTHAGRWAELKTALRGPIPPLDKPRTKAQHAFARLVCGLFLDDRDELEKALAELAKIQAEEESKHTEKVAKAKEKNAEATPPGRSGDLKQIDRWHNIGLAIRHHLDGHGDIASSLLGEFGTDDPVLTARLFRRFGRPELGLAALQWTEPAKVIEDEKEEDDEADQGGKELSHALPLPHAKSAADALDLRNQVVPLALAAILELESGDRQAAERSFSELRHLASRADLDIPIFAELNRLGLAWAGDWRAPYECPDDILPRPNLSELGPLRYQPRMSPDFSVPLVNGGRLDLSKCTTKPTVLALYLGSGCEHCVEQLDKIRDAHSRFEEAGFQVYAVGTERRAEISNWLSEIDKPYPFAFAADPKNRLFQTLRAYDDFEKTPLHGLFLIDTEGRIQWHDTGHEAFLNIDFFLNEAKRLLKG